MTRPVFVYIKAGCCSSSRTVFSQFFLRVILTMMYSLQGKVAIITGATSGIGAGTAVLFASNGCKITLTGRNAANLENTFQDCLNAGAKKKNLMKVIGDVTNEEVIKEIVENTVKAFQKIDILVNNAGILKNGNVEDTPLQRYDEIMNVNVRSLFYLTQLCIPYLKKTRGCVVNLSSIAGPRAFPGIAAYCISKAAVDQLTKCTALELAADGVRVNCVNPGVIITEIHKRGGMSEEEYAKFLEHSKQTHALGRPGTVDEVAHAIAFLADETKSSFITGVNLPIDGGRGAMCPR